MKLEAFTDHGNFSRKEIEGKREEGAGVLCSIQEIVCKERARMKVRNDRGSDGRYGYCLFF